MQPPVRTMLLPGLRLTAVETRKFKTTCWSIQFVTPLEARTAPLNDLLPHVLRSGTARYPDPLSLSAALDRLSGGVVQPVSRQLGGVQGSGFLAYFPDPRFLPDAASSLEAQAKLLGDLLTRPATKNGRLRNTSLQEGFVQRKQALSHSQEPPGHYARRRMARALCRETPFFDPVEAFSNMKSISVSRLDRHYRTLLADSRIELFYCGPAPADQLRQVWTEALMDLPRRRPEGCPEPEPLPLLPDICRMTETLPGASPQLLVAFRAQNIPEGIALAAMLVSGAILEGFSASLPCQVHALLHPEKGVLVLQAEGGGGRQAADEEALCSLTERLRAGEFRLTELERARRQVISHLLAIEDSPQAMESFYFRQVTAPSLLAPDQLGLLVREVTAGDICRTAAGLTIDTIYTLAGEEA